MRKIDIGNLFIGELFITGDRYFSNSETFVEGRKRKSEMGKLKINGIVCQSVIYVSGRTQGSEFWRICLKCHCRWKLFNSLGQLLSSLELTNSKIFN